MSYLAAAAAVLIAAMMVLTMVLKSDAAAIARTLRLGGPVLLGLLGAAFLMLGRAGVGGILIALALAWLGALRSKTPRASRRRLAPRKQSSVRTAALEMELDHETGGLEGFVLAGRHEQRTLSTMTLPELSELYADLRGDSESRQLLETYLDGRFPAWREYTKTYIGAGKGIAPGPGPMTKQEAYQILGLEAGATAADIRKAHRRLMQRLNTGLGGSSVLAARINEAKDILLTNHH